MTEREKNRFAALCSADVSKDCGDGGIGTYMEKRLHRILKAFVTDRADCTEVAVGPYIADVREGDRITEIQTGSFRPLLPKLTYYLEQTDCSVTVIHPIFTEHLLIRVDPETGEVLRKRRSNRRGRVEDILPQLYFLRSLFPSERLCVRVLFLRVEEFRYSERVRYRRTGAYDKELFPRELLGAQCFASAEDLRCFLPEADFFTAAEYERFIKLKSRPANAALQTLCAAGLLERESQDRKYIYHRIP